MSRKPNTNRNGGNWTEAQKTENWEKGQIISGLPSDTWRNDKCGKSIKRSEHGNRSSMYGWEIDHINPVSNGGDDRSSNLQPLHWTNNVDKGDKLYWVCPK
ncbi:HNH endonuclease signature motif containing protein [Flagellimonas beolgyonensis]|uniref:HNH endonuclease signature motif containing protein n=1 Tax=Flagellimonas beolgyonensis TaxID=864064 RepID=UPI003D65C614